MSLSSSQRLQPIDLLRIYGNIEYDWNLITDAIDWQGSLTRLISPDVTLATGSSFCNLLTPFSFQERMKGIAEALGKADTYTIDYHITLSSYEQVPVHEEGDLIRGVDGNPLKLQGYICFMEENTASSLRVTAPMPLAGYDPLTGFPGKEVLFESLASLLTKSLEDNIPGAYMAVSIDQLNYLNVRYGADILQQIIKAVAEKLRSTIRFNDSIGRISSTCLGVILQECDRWGVLQASQRLTQVIESSLINTTAGGIPIKISCGGIVFPDKDLAAGMVMQQAEKCLFEAQSIKGAGIAWTPYGEIVQPAWLRKPTSAKGQQRAHDPS